MIDSPAARTIPRASLLKELLMSTAMPARLPEVSLTAASAVLLPGSTR
jgi:hypothetical protein